MQKVAIITDSIACLTRELVEQYGIRIVPYSFYFGGKVYRDWVDITPTEAYQLFLKEPESFYSSPASPSDYLEAYRGASQHAENIICITLSSKLSTAYDVARAASEQAKRELPQTSIEVVDSLTATAAQGFIALAVARQAEKGKSLAEMVKLAEAMRNRVSLIAFLDTVRYVYRSGRIPKVAARAGSMLDLRPIFTVSGPVKFLGIARSREQGINQLIRRMRDKVGQTPVHVAVMHAYAQDEAERLKERISSKFNCVELWLTEFSPLMGYACGTGTMGLAFYKED